MYITRTALIHLVTSKHATYLEVPPLGFEPRTDFRLSQRWKLIFQLVPGGITSLLKVVRVVIFTPRPSTDGVSYFTNE